jgi:hypothetical protein
MKNGKNIPNKRRSKEEGHMAQLVRRKMIQKNHGDKNKFNRNELKKKDRKDPFFTLTT